MRRSTKVMGVHAPPPHPTPGGIWVLVSRVGLPLLAVLVAFDVVVWLVCEAIWGVCIGLWCLF